MQSSDSARIGLITDDNLHRHILHTVLAVAGYQLALSLDAKGLTEYFENESNIELDAWVVDLVSVDAQQVVEILVENNDLPMLVNDEIPPIHEKVEHEVWQRRLVEKLEVVALRHETESGDQSLETNGLDRLVGADTVWVLAASLGGPDAIKRFLSALPEGLMLAMVYVQHIQVNFDDTLVNAIGSKHSYPMKVVRSEQQLLPGGVYVVPADRQLRFLPLGRVVATRKPWTGLYQPAINQVIADLARIYRNRLGVIIFSGLCDDGEIGCRVAKACGATVWVQAPESCQSPEMAEAALATGCVSFQGTPEQLANALTERYDTTD